MKFTIEFLDGSTYCGMLPRDNFGMGIYKKKSKLNESYYKSYHGEWVNGMMQGNEGTIIMNLSNWPRYHPLINLAS